MSWSAGFRRAFSFLHGSDSSASVSASPPSVGAAPACPGPSGAQLQPSVAPEEALVNLSASSCQAPLSVLAAASSLSTPLPRALASSLYSPSAPALGSFCGPIAGTNAAVGATALAHSQPRPEVIPLAALPRVQECSSSSSRHAADEVQPLSASCNNS